MLKIILLSVLFITASSCMTPEKLQQRAERQLNEFIASHHSKWELSEVIRVPDAKFTLLLIEQQHYSDILTNRVKTRLKETSSQDQRTKIKDDYFQQIIKINNVQKSIHDFISEVTNEKDFLYVEGRKYPIRYRKEFLKTFTQETIDSVYGVLNYGNISSHTIPQPPYFMGASIVLHNEQKLTVIGSENLGLLNLTLSLYENSKLSRSDLASFLKECHEAREDQMLENISKNFEELSFRMNSIRFLICGSKHDFKNNVEEWNVKNPDKKFNLVIHTPKGLR